MRFLARTALLTLLIPAASAAMAGTVEVSFVDPASFADTGASQRDQDANLQTLAKHLQSLGQRMLPADQVLKIEVLDVSLAGTVRRRGLGEVRVLRGGADFPTMHLRYTLQGGGVQRSGDEWVSDMTYTFARSVARYREPLYYEKRMLSDWFKDRFAGGHAPAG